MSFGFLTASKQHLTEFAGSLAFLVEAIDSFYSVATALKFAFSHPAVDSINRRFGQTEPNLRHFSHRKHNSLHTLKPLSQENCSW
jgi:hypothetical protein